MSLQLDESDNRITINEDIAHKQSQNMTDISKVTQNTDNTQVPYTTEITSTNVENIDTQNDEDTKEAEEQIAINHRQELTGDPLPTAVQYENLENQIYQCAPGENNIPKYILLDNDFEVLAFPDLFPYGSGGYHSANRKVKLPIRKYFQQHLLNIDGRFAQNIEYLFCVQYIADIKQIESDATLAICLSWGRTLGGHKITAGQLWNPAVVEQLVRNEQAYKFLKNVRGYTCLLARSIIWCTCNATNVKNSHMVLNIVSCWFTLAWDDWSSSCTVWEEIDTKRCTNMSAN